MLLDTSRGADAVWFCSEVLIRRNELQNRNLHFDKGIATRHTYFGILVSGKQRETPVLTKKVSTSTKKGLGLTTQDFQILGLRTCGSTSSLTKIQFWHLVEIYRKVGRRKIIFIDFVSKESISRRNAHFFSA